MTRVHPAQRGISLLMTLVMLFLITLIVILGYSLTRGSLQVSGNLQQKAQTLAAAQAALEQTVSSTAFTNTPSTASTSYASVNSSGNNDIQVVVTPRCLSSQPVPVAQLDYSNPDDAGCLMGVSQQAGVAGTEGNSSLCANQTWDLEAVATDTATRASANVHLGVVVRTAGTIPCP